ncbi:MAG: sterol desaturase family protein [Fibrobacterales bacterium]
MDRYVSIIESAYRNYASFLFKEMTHPSLHNYFYWLIGLSLIVWSLEIILPWRKRQPLFRRDFWLDGFYMFFNFFLFSLIVYNALSHLGVALFHDILQSIGIESLQLIPLHSLPSWVQMGILFLLVDLISWGTHQLLHRSNFLWRFHAVHHSVKEMGFAAHLRYHWMENIFYKVIRFIPVSLLGFGIDDFFMVHIATVAIGHLNHANVGWDYGPLKYLFNNPKMHIWHHSKKLPQPYRFGANFGITLSIWDYLFRTVYQPSDGRDIELGYPGDSDMPSTFIAQSLHPFKRS